MKGKLELNLEPASMCFVCLKNKVREFRYCDTDDLRSLLLDLKLIEASQSMPCEECLVRISGDFPAHVLAKFGLSRFSAVDESSPARAPD